MRSRNQAHKENETLQAILFILLAMLILFGSLVYGQPPA